MSSKASFRNLSQLRKTLKQLPRETTTGVATVIDNAAEAVLAEAKQRVPKDTGTLAQNLTRKTSSDGLSAEIGVRGKRAKKAAYYGKFVELGTIKQPAQPFLFPAVESQASAFVRELVKEVTDTLNKAGKL